MWNSTSDCQHVVPKRFGSSSSFSSRKTYYDTARPPSPSRQGMKYNGINVRIISTLSLTLASKGFSCGTRVRKEFIAWVGGGGGITQK